MLISFFIDLMISCFINKVRIHILFFFHASFITNIFVVTGGVGNLTAYVTSLITPRGGHCSKFAGRVWSTFVSQNNQLKIGFVEVSNQLKKRVFDY